MSSGYYYLNGEPVEEPKGCRGTALALVILIVCIVVGFLLMMV